MDKQLISKNKLLIVVRIVIVPLFLPTLLAKGVVSPVPPYHGLMKPSHFICSVQFKLYLFGPFIFTECKIIKKTMIIPAA